MCSQSEQQLMISTAEKMSFFHGEQAWGFQSDRTAMGDQQAGHHEEEIVKNTEKEEDLGRIIPRLRSNEVCARGHWRPAEDAKLVELVSQHGPQNWNLIAQALQGRSGKSCRLRWFNQLDPRIKKKPFTQEEEEKLLAAQLAYGNKWALIARLFPGRTDNAVKNHWHVIMSRKQRRQSSAYRRRKHPISTSTCVPNPPQFQCLFPGKVVVNAKNNACSGESSVTSTRDESVSTSTDLSLGSSNRATPGLLISCNHQFQQQQQQQQQQDFCEEGGRSSCHQGAQTFMLVPNVDQSGNSDSNSEVSAAESSVSYRDNEVVQGDKDHGREKIFVTFIDFLGVGETRIRGGIEFKNLVGELERKKK